MGDASLHAHAPLTAQTLGSGTSKVTIKSGTTAYVEVKVVGGKIVPSATSARFSKPLDTWGWTSVPGVYLDDQGKLYAEVSGMFDKDLTRSVTEALGTGGSSIPMSVNALAAGVAAKGKAGNQAGGTKAGSGSAAPPLVDTDALTVDGTVGLRSGTIRTDAVTATLGSEPGANVATVHSDGGRAMSVNFTRLVVDALGIEAGGVQVNVKNLKAGNAGASTGAPK